MNDLNPYADVNRWGAEYEAAQQTIIEARGRIFEWAFRHPEEALRSGLVSINYSKASKLRYRP